MREYSGLTLKDGKYNLEDVMKSMMDAYETRYNYIVKNMRMENVGFLMISQEKIH